MVLKGWWVVFFYFPVVILVVNKRRYWRSIREVKDRAVFGFIKFVILLSLFLVIFVVVGMNPR